MTNYHLAGHLFVSIIVGYPKANHVPIPVTLNFNRFLQRNGYLCLITVCQAAHGIFY